MAPFMALARVTLFLALPFTGRSWAPARAPFRITRSKGATDGLDVTSMDDDANATSAEAFNKQVESLEARYVRSLPKRARTEKLTAPLLRDDDDAPGGRNELDFYEEEEDYSPALDRDRAETMTGIITAKPVTETLISFFTNTSPMVAKAMREVVAGMLGGLPRDVTVTPESPSRPQS